MVQPFSALLGQSTALFKANFKVLLQGAVVIAIIMLLAQLFFQHKVTGVMGDQLGDLDRMEELAERMEEGDEAAFGELMLQMGAVNDAGEIDDAALGSMGIALLGGMAPALGLYTLIATIVSLLATVFYLIVAVYPGTGIQSGMQRALGLFFPFLGVSIWTFLRSFIWVPIPFVNLLLGLYFGPRLMLSPVIMVQEGQGVFASATASMNRTKGHWLKAFGDVFVLGLCMAVVMIVLGLVIGVVAALSSWGSQFLTALLAQLVTAYSVIFMVQLAGTITQNPMMPGQPPAVPSQPAA